jgi:biopolymer transport protein ExbD
MSGMDSGSERQSSVKKGKSHHKKRLGVRIDMTPMVDVAFLLLTFFMLTTYFSKPQAMEINLPPDDKTQVEVAESSLLTLRVLKSGSIYWSTGLEKPVLLTTNLRQFLEDRIRSNPKLITLVKIQREGTFNQMVDMMDELNVTKISRFSLVPFGEIDKRVLTKIGAM